MKKVISVFLLILIIFSMSNISNASSLGTIISGADGFLGRAEKEEIDNNDLSALSSSLFNTLLILAIAISVIVGAIIGIKLMVNGAEGKAQMKEAFVPYIVGNVVVFGAFGIWKLVVTVLNSLT